MKPNILLYGHGGCYNHGGEALIVCGIEALREHYGDCNIILSSHNPNQDREFHIDADEIVGRNESYIQYEKSRNYSIENNDKVYQSTIERITSKSVCIHLGGDNYCYSNWKRYANIHYRALEKGAKSILWSCSVDPDMIDNEMLDALNSHHLIAARESITYNALTKLGVKNVIKVSDIAFKLKPTPIPFEFENYVSITFGPLATRKEREDGIALLNFQNLVDFILRETDMNIVLVPHVICPTDNDIDSMSKIVISDYKRIHVVSERHSASQLKYIIGHARFCVTLRTHASIAAYSSCVPTLVVGYSSKSRGIAQDLNLSEYVIPVSDLTKSDDITSKFRLLVSNEFFIKNHLVLIMPQYIDAAICKSMFLD